MINKFFPVTSGVKPRTVSGQGGSSFCFNSAYLEAVFSGFEKADSSQYPVFLTQLGKMLDAADPCPQIREHFDRGEVLVAAGHSLGRPATSVRAALQAQLNRIRDAAPHGVHWGRNKSESEDHNFAYKFHLHEPSRRVLSQLLGGDVQDIMLGNGLSDDLVRLMDSLFHPQIFGDCNKILCLKNDFNSDMTIVRTFMQKSIKNALRTVPKLMLKPDARQRYDELAKVFLDPTVTESKQFDYIEKHFLVEVPPIPDSGGLYDEAVLQKLLSQHRHSLAGALLPSIVFDTGQAIGMKPVNKQMVDNGIPCIWDCAHSVGNKQHQFKNDGVLAAVGCGYKHLNGTPGTPGFVYQNEALLNKMKANFPGRIEATPVSGWLAHGAQDDFDVFAGINKANPDLLHPATSVQRTRASNPEIMALTVLIKNLEVFDQFDMKSLMARKDLLSELLLRSLDTVFEGDVRYKMITPRESSKRGATLCFSLKDVSAKEIEDILVTDELKTGKKFEIDVRPGKDGAPDTIRVTAHHCHMSFSDTVDLAMALKSAADFLALKAEPSNSKPKSKL